MKQEIKDAWVAALRSGKYVQGQGQLCMMQDGKFVHCCLGVLSALAVEAGIVSEAPSSDGMVLYGPVGGTAVGGYLPSEVKTWAGLQRQNPAFGGRILSHLNDDGVSFAEIAAHIEQNEETVP